jgi:antitoxin ParD1/3/4
MTISLTSEQQAKLNAYVARGDFASVEEAARQLIDERIAERSLEESDGLAWAQPYVDEAVEEVARGNVMSHEEYRARISTNFAKSKG